LIVKRFAWIAGAVVLLCLVVQPALAQTTCPPPDPEDNEACVGVSAGATAEDIAEDLGQNWNLPNYACSSTGASVTVTVEAGENEDGEKEVTFNVEADGNVDEPHALNFIFVSPTGSGEAPFDILLEFDGAEAVLLRDGTTNFADINIEVETAPPAQPGILPMLSGTRTALLVFGLLAAGVAILAFRRTS